MGDQRVFIKPQAIQWNPVSVTADCTRKFPGNALLFINLGTSTVKINDIFPLAAGASLSFENDQNEIDTGIYKLTVPVGGFLMVYYKENMGVMTDEEAALINAKFIIPDRRAQIKAKAGGIWDRLIKRKLFDF